MDVLRPQLVWIEGRCYRKLSEKQTTKMETSAFVEDEDSPQQSVENNNYDLKQCSNEEPCDAREEENLEEKLPIEKTQRGFSLKLTIANAYFRHIIGKNGDTKRRIEAETRTSIYVPRSQREEQIQLTNRDSEADLVACYRKIMAIVDLARQRQDPTHFLSIPFNCTEIQNKFEEFKNKVLSDYGNCRGIDENIFIESTKLHLTIGMMVLMSDGERETARQTLNECYGDVIKPYLQTIKLGQVELNGLAYMNDDPGEVDVLYAKIQSPGGKASTELQILVNKINEYFASRNVLTRNRDNGLVKMHVTLMNSRYRQNDDSSQQYSRFQRKETFDAKQILKNLSNTFFGRQNIDSMHISQRHTVSKDGYYFSTAKIDF